MKNIVIIKANNATSSDEIKKGFKESGEDSGEVEYLFRIGGDQVFAYENNQLIDFDDVAEAIKSAIYDEWSRTDCSGVAEVEFSTLE